MTAIIRPYAAADLEALLTSWESATRLAHPFMSDAFIAQSRLDIVEQYLPNTDTWVAEANREVVGFISLLGNEVGAVFLQPEYHGQGIGRALMDKARELHQRLEVEVFTANSIGRAFYAAYGFMQISESMHEPTGQPVLRLAYDRRS